MTPARETAPRGDCVEDDAMKKGMGKDSVMLVIEVIIVLAAVYTIFVVWFGSGSNPQKLSCGLCKDVPCPSGFSFAGDCTIDGSTCTQCKNSIKTCDGNTAEEWATATTCSLSKHIAQCVKLTDCAAVGKSCKDGECS